MGLLTDAMEGLVKEPVNDFHRMLKELNEFKGLMRRELDDKSALLELSFKQNKELQEKLEQE